MRKFLKEHGYDTALAIFVLVFGGSIIGLFGDVLAALGSYPWAVAACCGLSLVVGLGISAIADRRAVMVARVHEDGETERLKFRQKMDDEKRAAEADELRRRKEESDRLEEEEILDENEEQFRGEENAEKKVLAVALYGRPGHMACVDEYRIYEIQSIERGIGYSSWATYFEFEKFGGGIAHLTLAAWLENLFETRPEVLKGFPQSAIDKANAKMDEWGLCDGE